MVFSVFNGFHEGKLCDHKIVILSLFYRDLFDISHGVFRTAEAIRICFRQRSLFVCFCPIRS